MSDISEDEFRQLDHKPSKPGVLLTQRINLVVMFAATRRRLVLANGIFKQRRRILGRFVGPK
jgi:hypothetical protein